MTDHDEYNIRDPEKNNIENDNIIDINDSDNIPKQSTGSGRLIVRVFTASGAVPLSGAQVVVRNTPAVGGGIIASLITDRSGIAPTVSLSAPPKSEAQHPGSVRPYSVYGIDVFLDGYFTPVYESVPIYDGITSVQNVIMIPLPENGRANGRRPDDTIVYPEAQEPSL